MFDIAIIGGGPAALSAAITARQRDKATVVFKTISDRGWLQKAEVVNNYPGMYNISGKDMLTQFQEHADKMGADIKNAFVRQIMNMEDYFMLMAGDEIIEAKSIILATGAAQPKTLKNEERLLGSGVSYCGTCDGMLYRGKKVAVVSYAVQGITEANYLSGLAEEVIYVTDNKNLLKGLNDKVSVKEGKALEILGENKVTGVRTKSEDIAVDGVFIFRDAVAFSTLIEGIELSKNFIKVNRLMETNIKGLFAAGDCTGQPLQIAKAVGEGNIAAISASEYLDK